MHTETACFSWVEARLNGNKKTNREIFCADPKHTTVLALKNCTLPASFFCWKQRDFYNDFRGDGGAHAKCLTSEFTGLRGFSRRSGGMMGWADCHWRSRKL